MASNQNCTKIGVRPRKVIQLLSKFLAIKNANTDNKAIPTSTYQIQSIPYHASIALPGTTIVEKW